MKKMSTPKGDMSMMKMPKAEMMKQHKGEDAAMHKMPQAEMDKMMKQHGHGKGTK